MNKRNIDFTPKKTLPAALVKAMPEIIILPQERDDGRYLYIRDICRILGISRSSAYRLMDRLHATAPDKGISGQPGRISKEIFLRQLYDYAAGKDNDNGN